MDVSVKNNQKMLKRRNIIIIVISLACCVALAMFYATAYRSHILWQEQNQIFLNTSHWIATYFSKPAWLGCLSGDWITQYFHNPAAGAVILTLVIAYCTVCFAIGVRRMFPVTATSVLSCLFAILLIACSMTASTTMSFFMCVAGGLTLGLARVQIRYGKKHGLDISPLLVIPAYWSFGFGALISAAFMIAFSSKRALQDRGDRSLWLSALCAAVFAAATPAALCGFYALPYAKGLLYPGISEPSFPDFEHEERLAIADAFFSGNHERAKQLALNAASPNDISAFYYYLSSALQDSLPDNLLKYEVKSLGTLTTIGDKTPLPVINMMNDLYYELGDMTYAERAAMMRNVFSPRNRNVRMIRRLAEINLVSGDTLAALKYLRILGRTHAYAEWSREHMPGKAYAEVESEIARRRALSNSKDNIRLGDNCRNILLELLESNPKNIVALDYLLCTDLLLKDMDTFKMDYDTYCMSKGSPRYKDLYQEALMIYLAGTEASQEEWDRYVVPGPLFESFRRYSSRRGDPAFRGTYWYYFDKQ